MPGILSEEKAEGVCEGRGKETCEPVQENGTRSVSPATPSSVENGKASWNSSISDSDPNLNTSSASEPEVSGKTPAVTGGTQEKEEGESKEDALKKALSADSTVYSIHLTLPGVPQPIDVVLTSRDTVHDLLQFALERPECCYRTALSVHHKGKRLDDFFEIGSIEGFEDGDTMDVVEESYTQRDVRLHVQRLKELLSTNPLQNSTTNSDGVVTPSFLSAITLLDPEGGGVEEGTVPEPASYSIPRLSDSEARENDLPLSAFYPPNLNKHGKFPECLKSLSFSCWNPPPSKRKMKGDLLYLDVTTLEGQDYYITATPTGFFLNKSASQENFDPTPRKTPHLHKHLVGLLSQVSPLFKKNFAQVQKFGSVENMNAFEILPVPYAITPWVSPKPEHRPNNFRVDDTLSLRALPDESVLGQMRDWNEELQIARELPTDTSSAKVFRDRALFKFHSDFVQACTRGAVAVVDGYLPSLNPGDEFKFRMYMWNNIFFSLAFDGRDHYKEFGGDNAAHVAASADLQGVASLEKLDHKDLYTLGTVLVDYRGYRVVCQTIIPGLLQREHDSAVVYGSIDTGRNVSIHQRFVELLKKVGDELHIREHKVHTDKEEVVTIPSSLEVKGIIGNDNRHYALDLFRIFPPDANYMLVSEGAKFRHKMAILRPEFLDTFLSFKFMLFLKLIELKQLQDTAVDNANTSQSNSSATNNSSDTKTDTATAAEQTTTDTTDIKDTADQAHTNTADTGDTQDPATDHTESTDTDRTVSNTDKTPTGSDQKEEEAIKKDTAASVSFPAVLSPNRSVLSSSSSSGPHPKSPPSKDKDREVEGLYLLETKTLAEEKEVGSDIPCGLADEDLSAMRESEGVNQPAALIAGGPEVSLFKEALEAVGSSSLEEFVIRFNVDILSPLVKHADEESVLTQDKRLVHDASTFLVESIVPRFVRDCIQLTVTPTEGESLTMAMHARGINMRYLGRIAALAALRDDLHHLRCLCLSEMTVRLAKRRLRRLLQDTPLEATSDAISHYLNCFLSNVESKDTKEESSLSNGHMRKKNKKKKGSRGHKVPPHLKLNSDKLWQEFVDEMDWYYKFKMPYTSVTEMCKETGIGKLALLRQLCKKTGVQVLLRDYDFSHYPVFTDDDITAVFPVVQHTQFKPMEPTAIYEMAISKFSSGHLQVAHELFANSLQMYVQVYGPLHADAAHCYRQMARIEYMLGDYVNALNNQHKATFILERALGADDPDTILSYINLALYCQANGQSTSALKLLFRARYLLKLVFGEDHPEMATCDSNLAVILHSLKDYKNSYLYLANTLILHNKYHGPESLQAALTHHLLARAQSYLGDFRVALTHEKTTFSIYQKKLGVEHERTKESSQCLKELTEKAVTMQKTIKEMTSKANGGKVLVELPGSWGEVVGMVNGVDSKQQVKTKQHVTRRKNRRAKAPSSPNSVQSQT